MVVAHHSSSYVLLYQFLVGGGGLKVHVFALSHVCISIGLTFKLFRYCVHHCETAVLPSRNIKIATATFYRNENLSGICSLFRIENQRMRLLYWKRLPCVNTGAKTCLMSIHCMHYPSCSCSPRLTRVFLHGRTTANSQISMLGA